MPLKSEFERAVADRGGAEDRFKECAAFTIPSVLPPANQSPDEAYLRPYQSLGADGIKNLVNKIVVALFPPGSLWFKHDISPKLRDDPTVAEGQIEQLNDFLYKRDLAIYAQFNSMRYRGKVRTQVENLLVIGNCLAKMTDEYRLKVFRFDQWVQKRGSDSSLVWVITKESQHPSQLREADIEKAELTPDELDTSNNPAKVIDIYTKCARKGLNRWYIEQEIKDKQVRDSVESVNPYFAPGYVEVPGEDYSRGFVEEIIGDLRAYNGLNKAILEGTSAAATVYPCVDETKGWTQRDLTKPNLSVLIGRVTGNVPDGIGFLRTDKNADFAVAMNQAATIEKRLEKQFLMETSLQPQGDRVTAYQVSRIARELEGALGGVYIEIAEELQRPMLERLIYQMERDKLLLPLPPELKDVVNLHVLTGLEALGRSWELERAVAAFQILAAVPGVLEKVKPSWIINTVLRGHQIDPRDALKTDEEVAAEQQAAEEAQARMLAQEQMVKTAGALVEGAAKPVAQGRGV